MIPVKSILSEAEVKTIQMFVPAGTLDKDIRDLTVKEIHSFISLNLSKPSAQTQISNAWDELTDRCYKRGLDLW